jgi:hypothetical protein
MNVWRLGASVALQWDKSPRGVMKNESSDQTYIQRKWHNCEGLRNMRERNSLIEGKGKCVEIIPKIAND